MDAAEAVALVQAPADGGTNLLACRPAGVVPPGGSHLRFCAVDLGRSTEGKWWVLSDRTQAPSGAGYALENRLALARALPDVYRALHVERRMQHYDRRAGASHEISRPFRVTSRLRPDD